MSKPLKEATGIVTSLYKPHLCRAGYVPGTRLGYWERYISEAKRFFFKSHLLEDLSNVRGRGNK